jgi:hypothetical protein
MPRLRISLRSLTRSVGQFAPPSLSPLVYHLRAPWRIQYASADTVDRRDSELRSPLTVQHGVPVAMVVF